MVGHDVAAPDLPADQLRMVLGLVGDHEERPGDVVAVEDVEDRLREPGVGAVVERQRHDPVGPDDLGAAAGEDAGRPPGREGQR